MVIRSAKRHSRLFEGLEMAAALFWCLRGTNKTQISANDQIRTEKEQDFFWSPSPATSVSTKLPIGWRLRMKRFVLRPLWRYRFALIKAVIDPAPRDNGPRNRCLSICPWTHSIRKLFKAPHHSSTSFLF